MGNLMTDEELALEMLAKGRQWIADNPTEAWERVKRFLDEPPEFFDDLDDEFRPGRRP